MRPLSLVLALALLASAAFGSSNDAGWQRDLDSFATELPRLHVNAFTRISRSQFNAAVQTLRADVPSLADHEVLARLLRITASIGDAHTSVYLPSDFTRFPLVLYWFSDGLHVTRTAEADRDLLGARVVAIETQPIEDVATQMAALIPHENEWWLRELLPDRVTRPELLHALRIIPTIDRATFRFELRDGTTVERTFERTSTWTAAPLEGTQPLYLRNPQANYWYDYAPATGTLYVQYNRCVNDPARPIDAFGRELARVAMANRVTRLVFDVRQNGGGDSSLLGPLLSPLLQAAPHLNDPDRFFVVIGPATISSSLMNAVQLDQETRATLIGRPTGGKPNHFGNVRQFALPSTRLTVQYSTRFFQLAPGSDPDALSPEIPVDMTSADYVAGRDPVMDRIVPPPVRRRAARG